MSEKPGLSPEECNRRLLVASYKFAVGEISREQYRTAYREYAPDITRIFTSIVRRRLADKQKANS